MVIFGFVRISGLPQFFKDAKEEDKDIISCTDVLFLHQPFGSGWVKAPPGTSSKAFIAPHQNVFFIARHQNVIFIARHQHVFFIACHQNVIFIACRHNVFLAALAALYMTLVTKWLTATSEFLH